jgi:hypothetical protein
MILIPLLQSYISIGDYLLACPHEAAECSVCSVIGVIHPD